MATRRPRGHGHKDEEATKGVDGSDKELTKASETHIVRMLGDCASQSPSQSASVRRPWKSQRPRTRPVPRLCTSPRTTPRCLPRVGYILHGLAHEDDGADDLWCALRRLEMAGRPFPDSAWICFVLCSKGSMWSSWALSGNPRCRARMADGYPESTKKGPARVSIPLDHPLLARKTGPLGSAIPSARSVCVRPRASVQGPVQGPRLTASASGSARERGGPAGL